MGGVGKGGVGWGERDTNKGKRKLSNPSYMYMQGIIGSRADGSRGCHVFVLLSQVRIAQGPDGAGFKAGHRASASFYAPSSSSSAILEGNEATSDDFGAAPSSSPTVTLEENATTSDDIAAESTISQGEEEQKTSSTEQAAEVAVDGDGQ